MTYRSLDYFYILCIQKFCERRSDSLPISSKYPWSKHHISQHALAQKHVKWHLLQTKGRDIVDENCPHDTGYIEMH